MRDMKAISLAALIGSTLLLVAATAGAEPPKPPYPYDADWTATAYTKTTPWTSLTAYEGIATYLLSSDVADTQVIVSPAFGARFTVHVNHRWSFPFTFVTQSARVPNGNMAADYRSAKFSDLGLQAGARVAYFMHQYCDFGLGVNVGFDIFKESFKSGDLNYKLEGTEPLIGGELSFQFFPTDFLQLGVTLGANYAAGTREATASGTDKAIEARSGATPYVLVSEGFHF
jgi:hypothetical protein